MSSSTTRRPPEILLADGDADDRRLVCKALERIMGELAAYWFEAVTLPAG